MSKNNSQSDEEQDYEMEVGVSEDELLNIDKDKDEEKSSSKPIIIQVQPNEIVGSRKVIINPEFDGFTSQKPSNQSDVSITDLRQVVNKRKQHISEKRLVCYSDLDLFESSAMNIEDEEVKIEAYSGNDEEKNLIENEKLKNLSLEIQSETDEERKYILLIEKQKMEREKVIREKEIKRKLEGWRFN